MYVCCLNVVKDGFAFTMRTLFAFKALVEAEEFRQLVETLFDVRRFVLELFSHFGVVVKRHEILRFFHSGL